MHPRHAAGAEDQSSERQRDELYRLLVRRPGHQSRRGRVAAPEGEFLETRRRLHHGQPGLGLFQAGRLRSGLPQRPARLCAHARRADHRGAHGRSFREEGRCRQTAQVLPRVSVPAGEKEAGKGRGGRRGRRRQEGPRTGFEKNPGTQAMKRSLATVFLLLCGCAGVPKTAMKPMDARTLALRHEAFVAIRSRNESLRSLKGLATVRYGSKLFGVKGDTAFAMEKPGDLRIDALSDFGTFASQVIFSRGRLLILWPSQNHYFEGAADREAIE